MLIRGFFNPQPVLIANQNGIFLCRLDILIPWNCIEEFRIQKIIGLYGIPISSVLLIDVKNHDEILARLPLHKKLWQKASGSSFSIMHNLCGYKAVDFKMQQVRNGLQYSAKYTGATKALGKNGIAFAAADVGMGIATEGLTQGLFSNGLGAVAGIGASALIELKNPTVAGVGNNSALLDSSELLVKYPAPTVNSFNNWLSTLGQIFSTTAILQIEEEKFMIQT